MTTGMKIGELAQETSCTVATVRYYEREGLLPTATRSGGNYRVYGPSPVERLAFIRHCRSLDMTHDEIRTLLAFRDAPDRKCDEVNTVLEEHIGHVVHRIGELKQLERELKKLRSKCQQVRATRDCAIMQSLVHDSRSVSNTGDDHRTMRRTHR